MRSFTETLIFGPYQPGSGIQRGWTVGPKMSLGSIDHTLGYYAVNISLNKLWTGILYTLRFNTVWEINRCVFPSKRYKGSESSAYICI